MYVQVRTIDAKKKVTVNISKLTTVEEFKEIVEKELEVKTDKQRLFYRGKQLEDGYKLFDYNINVNDVVQLMIKADVDVSESTSKADDESESKEQPVEEKQEKQPKEEEGPPRDSEYFKIGDFVDAKDGKYGAWFEAKILNIHQDLDKVGTKLDEGDDGLCYKVAFRVYEHDGPEIVSLKDIRPMSREIIPFSEIKEGDVVMVNYNIEEPKYRGFWYDMNLKSVVDNKKKPFVKGTIMVGTENTPLDDCIVTFTDEIMKIEKNKKCSERTQEELDLMQTDVENKRKHAPFCSGCGDNPRKRCKICSCAHCGKKEDPGKQIVCDECQMCYHIWCLTPPLEEVPDVDEWYCNNCKNDESEIVKAGEKLKESKKKAKMPSATTNTTRDWGKGMACVGRMKECTLVPPNHFGEIPGIEVGTIWKFRVQVSEAGIHRPHVAGIHGRESDGAYSIVLSGGYEDDIDNGEEFMYTGSGGRDLSGNKRTAEQSCDQMLTRMNKALAMNCNASVNSIKGAEASDWKGGKPVRVVRNFKLGKHSKYAPEEGNRYDGIYKVVKYYPEKGKSGFTVWRYLLRRDDPAPAPWTKEGIKRIASLGLEIIYPEGYLDAMEKKDKENKPENGLKRFLKSSSGEPNAKKPKVAFSLDKETEEKIKDDDLNEKRWNSALEHLSSGKKIFLEKTEEEFMCICCQELVHKPVTTPCKHNICRVCLERSFSAEVFNCPACRETLGRNYEIVENEKLQKVLTALFPGYSAAR